MAKSLAERWMRESRGMHEAAVSSRLYSAIYGGILGGLCAAKKDGLGENIKKIFDCIEYILANRSSNGFNAGLFGIPLLFTGANTFDFPVLVRQIEQSSGNADAGITLGNILCFDYLMRLYHRDGFDRALDMAVDVCGKKLKDTQYENHFGDYKDILEKRVLSCDQTGLSAGPGFVPSAAIWCCLNNNTFVDTVNTAANFSEKRESIACLAGTMAGLFYREDGIMAYQPSDIPDKKSVDSLLERYLAFILKGGSECL